MRMRRKPWARPELAACDFFIDEPETLKGKWNENFAKKQPTHLELGCGKGLFTAQIAFRNPEINYIAIDIKSEVLALAKRNIENIYNEENRKIDNILLMSWDIERLHLIFDESEKVDRIYINFCNPWPKQSHNKRRLTYTKQLEMYKLFLKKGGEIHFKTDDENLFFDSLEYFEKANLELIFKTEDLTALNLSENIQTEHEKMFVQMGKKIYSAHVKKSE